MDENALHQWLIESFGPMQGEMAYNQFMNLPQEVRDQLLSADLSRLPDPQEVQSMMQAFAGGGLNSFGDMQQTLEEGPINIKLARAIALQRVNSAHSETTVSATEGNAMRRATSEANLWLDIATAFNPPSGAPEALTRAAWVEGTIDAWAHFAAPVAASMNEALSAVISDRLGDSFDGEITGMYAGPIPIPIPEGMRDPKQLMKLFANTSYAMQLGQAAGAMSLEVHGSFDQGIALLKNPAGGLIMQNVNEFATSLDMDATEVTTFLALREQAYARLFASVPWLMPRFNALISKYARGIDIDLDAMEEQLRDASAFDPESLSGAVNLSNVGLTDSEEQREALHSIENLLALVEGWVDTIVWRAGMAHLPHIDQLREMIRRERATGGPAEQTFENLLGLQLRPKRMREAAALWEQITHEQGFEARDAMWAHPDLLPELPDDRAQAISDGEKDTQKPSTSIDWDAELNRLLDEDLNADTEVDIEETEETDDSSDTSSDTSTNTTDTGSDTHSEDTDDSDQQ